MQNIKMERDGDTLHIEVDLSEPIGPSSTGKTTLYAKTEGNATVPGDGEFKIGLNVFQKNQNAA